MVILHLSKHLIPIWEWLPYSSLLDYACKLVINFAPLSFKAMRLLTFNEQVDRRS